MNGGFSLPLIELTPAFERNIQRNSEGCWIWTGFVDKDGYGRMCYRGKGASPHRVAYEAYVGPIPPNFEIDHLCCNPSCANPMHLEAVTRAENMARARHAQFNLCKRGHDLTEAKLYDGHRVCLKCRAIRLRREGRPNRPRALFCRNGHSRTKENTKITPRGHRLCRICLQATEKLACERDPGRKRNWNYRLALRAAEAQNSA